MIVHSMIVNITTNVHHSIYTFCPFIYHVLRDKRTSFNTLILSIYLSHTQTVCLKFNDFYFSFFADLEKW